MGGGSSLWAKLLKALLVCTALTTIFELIDAFVARPYGHDVAYFFGEAIGSGVFFFIILVAPLVAAFHVVRGGDGFARSQADPLSDAAALEGGPDTRIGVGSWVRRRVLGGAVLFGVVVLAVFLMWLTKYLSTT